jgi:N-succinyldiaminopimelate aminotransferase
MKPTNRTFSALGTTIFEVSSRLSAEHGSINLGQGFPDDKGPDDVRAKAAEFLEDQPNQYPPLMGVPDLRQAVAAHDKRFYGMDVDWERGVLVTAGATEALASCLLGLIEPGDEVVVLEPFYDSYLPIIRRAGGIPRIVRLMPPSWELPKEELAKAFTSKTKLIVLNSPMNPISKLFSEEELSFLADLLIQHDAYAVCDEVYEHLVFDGNRHIPLITLPGMSKRCLRIGSAGKTFSLTGWKIGYIVADPVLLQPVIKAHQFITFTVVPNLQRAVAYGLRKSDDYFHSLAQTLQEKRDFLSKRVTAIGFDVLACAGSYFITTDISQLGFDGDDVAFCEYITVEAGVTAIPLSAFYENAPPTNFVRLAFCKNITVLEEAAIRLEKHFNA